MKTRLARKIFSAVFAAAMLIFALPVNAFAKPSKVTLYGCSISVHAKQVCFVKGEGNGITDRYHAMTCAEFPKYFYVGDESVIDFELVAEKLPELQNLAVINCDVKNPNALSELDSLVWLGLFNNKGAEDLSFLKKLTGLKKFRYENMKCKGTKPLSRLKGLDELRLYTQADAFKDISFVSGMTELSDLALKGGFTDLSPLSGIESVKRLSLNGAFEDLSPLSGMKNLREIEIKAYGGAFSGVSSLGKLKKLRSLSIEGGVSDCAEIAKINGLTSLCLSYTKVRNFDALLKMPYLKKLVVARTSGLSEKKLKNVVSEMTELETFGVDRFELKDCGFLEKLEKLKELELSFCGTEDISAVANMKDLELLSVSSANLNDISAVKGLKKLKYITFYSAGVTDISALKGLTKLKELSLSFNGVEDISPVAGLDELEYLDVCDTSVYDLSPALKLKGLKTLICNEEAADESFTADFKKINPGCEIIGI